MAAQTIQLVLIPKVKIDGQRLPCFYHAELCQDWTMTDGEEREMTWEAQREWVRSKAQINMGRRQQVKCFPVVSLRDWSGDGIPVMGLTDICVNLKTVTLTQQPRKKHSHELKMSSHYSSSTWIDWNRFLICILLRSLWASAAQLAETYIFDSHGLKCFKILL